MSSLLSVSQKCQYALRALFELSLHYPPVSVLRVSDIARTHAIPPRFLEQILSKMRTGGYIDSRRGNQGGYVMAVAPSEITVGEIIRFIEGEGDSLDCMRNGGRGPCRHDSTCVFRELWQQARASLSTIFDATTFQDLVDRHRLRNQALDFSI